MLSAKLATLGLVKVKLFWNKSYDVIIFVHDVTNKSLPHELNEIVDVVGWPMFGNSSSISMRSYHNLSFIRIWQEKLLFLRSGLGSSSIIWDWHKVRTLSFLPVGKRDKTKSQKVLRANFYVFRSYREKSRPPHPE